VEKYVGGLPDMVQGSVMATKPKRMHEAIEIANDLIDQKNQNHGNQAKGIEARGMVYALGGGETNQDLDEMEDDINA
nr:reverse transcriptase domain-containing protein [Tanacetum cinerariifolium]